MHASDSLPWFMWMWVAMSAAMMLPSTVLAASLAARLGCSATIFVTGYLVVWCATGLFAFEAAQLLNGAGKGAAAVVLLTAAGYQLSPAKDALLLRCRGPLGPLLRRRTFGAGVEHGLVCLGCCWALMLALLVLGVGSLLWMGALAVVIFVEKVTSFGARATTPVAAALLGAALWVAL